MPSKTIFISYSWKSIEIANRIYQDLALIGIKVIKDNFEIREFDSIPKFMEKIQLSDYSLILLSDEYLKSRNCMFEILKLFEINSELVKALPILTDEIKIFNIIDQIEYIKYWEMETLKLENSLEHISTMNSQEVIAELKIYKDISFRIGKFLHNVSSKKLVKFEELKKYNYLQILEEMKTEASIDHIIELLSITKSDSAPAKLRRLNKFEIRYGTNSFFYGLRGLTYRQLKKYDQARRDYELSIELMQENYESLNNLGFLLDDLLGKYDEAKIYYINAIKANPYYTIARLNLGVLYSKENEIEKAKNEYEEILKYEPTNEKAHSNLGNIYRDLANPDYIKAEFHLKRAVELNPSFINGLINYGNYLKVQKGEIEKGNSFYELARNFARSKVEIKMLEIILNTDKF